MTSLFKPLLIIALVGASLTVHGQKAESAENKEPQGSEKNPSISKGENNDSSNIPLNGIKNTSKNKDEANGSISENPPNSSEPSDSKEKAAKESSGEKGRESNASKSSAPLNGKEE